MPRPKTRGKGESPFWPLRRSRSAMVALHRYVGLVLAPLLVVIGLTGSISVFRTELDRMLNPDLWTTQSQDRHLPLSALVAAIAKKHPDQP
nr:PepSY-associated TM helix domain-containing protein [Asaia platycodi]